jgi:hypothetical protein
VVSFLRRLVAMLLPPVMLLLLLLSPLVVRVVSFPRMHHQVSSSIKVAKVRPSFHNRQIQTVLLV